MESNIIEKIIQFLAPLKIPADFLLGTFLFMWIILSFIPHIILQKIELLNIANEYKLTISIIGLFSLSYFIIKILNKIYSKLIDFWGLQKSIKILNNLPKCEKDIVIKMYKNGHSDYLSSSDPNVGSLYHKNIIYRSVDREYYKNGCGFTLQNWVVEYFDKNKN